METIARAVAVSALKFFAYTADKAGLITNQPKKKSLAYVTAIVGNLAYCLAAC